jgi:hypothetical protein
MGVGGLRITHPCSLVGVSMSIFLYIISSLAIIMAIQVNIYMLFINKKHIAEINRKKRTVIVNSLDDLRDL